MKYSNAQVGNGFVYADGNWVYPDLTGKWMIRGTAEDVDFGLIGYYQPTDGPQQAIEWWSLTNTADGLLNSARPPAGRAYNASMVNDAFTKQVYVRDHPMVYLEYQIKAFEGDKVRATVGVSMRTPEGEQVYIERNLKRTENFDLCPDSPYERCATNVTYFAPADGPLDVRALVLQTPRMTPERADSLRIAGVYIGSEIFGAGRVDLLIKSYSVQ